MSREIMQQALDLLKSAYVSTALIWDRADCVVALEAELAKPEQQFYPDWDMLKPYHDRISELEARLAKPEQEKPEWQELYKDEIKEILNDGEEWSSLEFAQAVSDLLREKNT